MLQHAWFNRKMWVYLLYPFTLLFWCLSASRRLLYKRKVFKVTKGALPVIVVGNISVGGNGKTPVCLALASYLAQNGYTPAIVSRGYGGSVSSFPHVVSHTCLPCEVGDEPALMHQRLGITVVIDPIRARACEYIEQHTKANVIICDDGLQHYAMARDIELCVIDARGVGNGQLLPVGPLREGRWRLNTVDACIINASLECFDDMKWLARYNSAKHRMQLSPRAWVNVNTAERIALDDFTLKQLPEVVAIAGIGNPQRFFDTLSELGVSTTSCTGFADHHQFTLGDIETHKTILMTEKDAVKCKAFAHEHCWYLEVDALLPSAFYSDILCKLTNIAK